LRRRDVLTWLGGAAAFPLTAHAQAPVPTIGYISSRSAQSDAPFVGGFHRGLAEGGFIDGQSAKIEFRWANNQPAQLAALADDLVRSQPAVILTGGGAAPPLAIKKVTSSIPIVFVIGTDPVKAGIVGSLNRPEANTTGVSFLATEIVAKRLELLLAFVPNPRMIAVLVNPNNPAFAAMSRDVEGAERALKLPLKIYKATSENEIDAAFAQLIPQRPDALFIGGDTFFNAVRRKIIALSLRHALPTIFDVREFAVEGGLMSYGSSQTDAYRQGGVYVGRILKGAKPADLPVIQSTRFELVINLTTAKALGLEVPTKLMALADEIIE
jgi:putative ABC transport system substrate-binding protein